MSPEDRERLATRIVTLFYGSHSLYHDAGEFAAKEAAVLGTLEAAASLGALSRPEGAGLSPEEIAVIRDCIHEVHHHGSDAVQVLQGLLSRQSASPGGARQEGT